MASPLGALVDLVGPFLIPVALFALGVAGYGMLLALGRLGVVDDGSDRFRSDGPTGRTGTDGRSRGSSDAGESGSGDADARGAERGDADARGAERGDATDGRRL